MDGLKNYREKIKNIEKLVDKMENGELSIHELVELEGLTRDLHERSIILKYKAFESKVDGNDSQESVSEEENVFVEEVIDEVEEEVEAPEAEEAPVLDFSMFSEPEEEKESKFEMEDVPVIEEESEPEVEVSSEMEGAEDETTEEPMENSEPETEEPKVVVREKGTSFLDRLSIEDNSISSQLAGRKIDTLSGAFGINERLLYINQLFDGSGEEFSDAIKVLDTQRGLDEASNKVEELAFKHSWNPEEETVLEFLAIIKRRYA